MGKTFDGVCSIGKDPNLQLAASLNEEALPLYPVTLVIYF